MWILKFLVHSYDKFSCILGVPIYVGKEPILLSIATILNNNIVFTKTGLSLSKPNVLTSLQVNKNGTTQTFVFSFGDWLFQNCDCESRSLFSDKLFLAKHILRISDKARYNLNAGCKKPEVLWNRKSSEYKRYSIKLPSPFPT